MLGRELIERQQGLAVLLEALGGLLVFQRVGGDEGVEGSHRLDPRRGHPDLLQ